MSNEELEPGQPNAASSMYHCPQCGAGMTYDAGTQQMSCGHCGHTMAMPTSDGHQVIVEYDLEHGLAMSRQRGYGTAVRSTVCRECGATVAFTSELTATACEFCGSSQVMEQDANRQVLRPESLVPFQIERDAAQAKFSAWLGGLWFRPSDLKHKAKVASMNGVYVPYWTFDAHVRSNWTAQAGYYYYVTETYTSRDAQGRNVEKTRRVQKVRWEPAWGSRADRFDDVLICASRGLPADLAERLRTFDTSSLRPYEPAYLSGWKAEEYAVPLNEGWKRAVAAMETVQEGRCARDVPGDTHRFLNVSNRFSDETFKHVLLPIWISAYRYQDRVFQFLVNGQTGEVTGKAPYSVVKIVLFVLLLAAIAVAAVFLFQRR